MLVRLRLVFPSCLERWAACASGSRPVPSALALATTGLVTVRQHDLSAPMYDARGSRRLAQANYASYTWEHGARSDGEGYVQLGLFHSDVLEGAPPLKLRLSFGDQLIAPIMDIPRRKVPPPPPPLPFPDSVLWPPGRVGIRPRSFLCVSPWGLCPHVVQMPLSFFSRSAQ